MSIKSLIAVLLLFPRVAAAAVQVHCDDAGSLQRAVDVARPDTTILVSGTCNENVVIRPEKNRITLDGGGSAAINGVVANLPTVSIQGRDITIRGFAVTGGADGIEVARGGAALIDGNVVRGNGNFGISLVQDASATIVNNVVRENTNAGIAISSSSSAWIGFVSFQDAAPSANQITDNGQQRGGNGIVVRRGSNAVIAGNTLSNNTGNGIRITESSYARVSANTIDANQQNGIAVEQGSGLVASLPPPPGQAETWFTAPNVTTLNNAGFGVRCQIGGYTDGRLGTLNGVSGSKSYVEGCIDSLNP
jgi:parallel beta-helix repeat protein